MGVGRRGLPRRRRWLGGSGRLPARVGRRVVAVDLDTQHCASHSSARDGRARSLSMSTTVEPPIEAPGAGVIDDARARQRRQRGIAGLAAIAAAGVVALALALAHGGGAPSTGRGAVHHGRPSAAPSLARKTAPNILGETLDRAEATLRADGLGHHFGVGFVTLTGNPGPTKDWTVCSTQPKARQPLRRPLLVWLVVHHTCG